MQLPKVDSPRVVHFDAIHHTNLLNGVKVNVGKAAEDGWEVIHTDSEDRYHIQTICRRIADDFFAHKEEEEYVPCDFQMRPILSIELDSDFRAHALHEFASKKVFEQEPPLHAPRHELVGSLTNRLVEAFESSGMREGHYRLNLEGMREIRSEVFGGGRRVEERKSSPSRRDLHPARVILDRSPRASRHRVEDPECCCSPTVVASAGLLSGLFVVVALFCKMFSDENEKGQRLSRVDKLGLNAQMNSRGTIY